MAQIQADATAEAFGLGDQILLRVLRWPPATSSTGNVFPRATAAAWLSERAFGSPAFTDLPEPYGWDYAVRVQDQSRFRDQQGTPLHSLLHSGR